MPIGFPKNEDVTRIENIEKLPSSVPPLSEALLRLDDLLDGETATDWGVKYMACVNEAHGGNFLRGDVHNARCRVRDAYNRCLIKKDDINEYREDLSTHEKYKANVDQVQGYLEIAYSEFLTQAFSRIDCDLSDEEDHTRCDKLQDELEEISDIIEKHRKAAERGIVYEGPPVESIL